MRGSAFAWVSGAVLLGAALLPQPAVAQGSLTVDWLFEPLRPQAPAKPPRARRPSAGATVAGRIVPSPWRILRTAWTESDEKGYEEFVAHIGESSCRSVHACLTGAQSNPLYHASNPSGMYFYADCADLPYLLRGYYAWKNNLPFSYSTEASPLGRSRDIRYTARGNEITARRDLVEPDINASRVLRQVADTITSAHYRYPPDYKGEQLPHHYPVAITREAIKPGTVLYDPNGHVAIVYKVTPEGRVHYIDTHPDNSLTRGIYGKAFTRASPGMGAGFKRWRPQTLEGASKAEDGSYRGGRIVLAADADLEDWSDEQFFGTATPRPKSWSRGKFAVEEETLPYYDFVRQRLAKAGFRYDPVDETRTRVRALCEDLRYRVDAIDIAVKAGLHEQSQPGRLPDNIYGTDGDWETYATPSRDARLKTSFVELRDEVARFLELGRNAPEKLAYTGDNLPGDLRRAYLHETAACTIRYTRSDGVLTELTFAEVAQRLFQLSFDPYHCVERRWGASTPGELATCGDGPHKTTWYEAEQRLRNQPDRTYDIEMGFSLGQLNRAVPGSGIDEPPDIDVLGLLQTSATLRVGAEEQTAGRVP